MGLRDKKSFFRMRKLLGRGAPPPGVPLFPPVGGGGFDFPISDPGGQAITVGGDLFGVPVSGTIPGTGAIDIDLTLGGDTGPPGSFAPVEGCLPFFTPDPITGECRFDIDPGPGQGLPGGNGAAGGGLTRPRRISREIDVCPRFADGKQGILWMNALTGDVVCLPRRTSGKGFGLIRKNKPRAKPVISAAEGRLATKIKAIQTRGKKHAEKLGFSCKKR